MQPATLLDAYVIYEAAGLAVGPRDAWLEQFKDSVLWPICRDDKLVGMILIHQVPSGQVLIHIGVLPEWKGKWATKAMWKAYPNWKPTCPVYAVVKHNNGTTHKLVKRLGFKHVRDSGEYRIYEKELSHES